MKKIVLKYIKEYFSKGSYSPKKFLLIYTVIIIPVVLIIGSFVPDEQPQTIQNASIIDSATLKEPVKKKKKKQQEVVIDSSEFVDPVKLKLAELMRVYDARNFDDLEYEFTYDLQKDLVGSKILFYAYISDIFQEGKDVYIKALKSASTKNYYLKVKCDTATANILRNNGLFSYFVVNVTGAQKVFLNTFSSKARAKNPAVNSPAESVPEKETVLITGNCLATIKQE